VTHLVDSDQVADWLNGVTRTVQLLTALSASGLAISIITYGEIYDGIYYGREPRRTEGIFRQFLRDVDVLLLTRPVMRRFARLRGQLRRGGQPIGDMDLLIAATALQHNLTLVTRNEQHFRRVPGLQLIRP
jgi:predicted nucleic acid-binding protein